MVIGEKEIHNLELYRIYKQSGINKVIKINRMNLMTYETWMHGDNTVKKAVLLRPTGTRRQERPQLRWADSVGTDFLAINEKNYS
ncbi:hypothetical protein TNCV_3836531 [Trichonephila clavipes]|nr:hypothetical protein TNCV_3836531 [Trichonephila clavipes]